MLQETVNIHYTKVFQIAQQALQELNLSVSNVDYQNWAIEASIGFSFLSWGENILIQINVDNQNNTVITISSKSKAQVISWGTNSTNENLILDKIKSLLIP